MKMGLNYTTLKKRVETSCETAARKASLRETCPGQTFERHGRDNRAGAAQECEPSIDIDVAGSEKFQKKMETPSVFSDKRKGETSRTEISPHLFV
jgi:hypothetical protein